MVEDDFGRDIFLLIIHSYSLAPDTARPFRGNSHHKETGAALAMSPRRGREERSTGIVRLFKD